MLLIEYLHFCRHQLPSCYLSGWICVTNSHVTDKCFFMFLLDDFARSHWRNWTLLYSYVNQLPCYFWHRKFNNSVQYYYTPCSCGLLGYFTRSLDTAEIMTVILWKCARSTCALLLSILRKCVIVFVPLCLTCASAALVQLVFYLRLKDIVLPAAVRNSS